MLLLALAACWAIAGPDPTVLQQQLIGRFGPGRVGLLNDWLQLVASARALDDGRKLQLINDFFNRRVVFDDDSSIWRQTDYWATPLETIGRGRGDCEDFAIAKYFSLRLADVPVARMRLVYVKARLPTASGRVEQAHMVLAYYSKPSAQPLVLDNLQTAIMPASKRPDLQPVFSFNSEGIFAGVSGAAAASPVGIGRLSRWQDLLQRAQAEGFE
ncbi:transglutaminase-like cysteine peptidase [Accumulibacter sp.]|mgnify:FL=1|uniref:transglutaminase-like cysteine peptidase n=1 Tax=Accumulibacter sp. TaxID=2053492 RepID=UPI00257B5FD0|nr:transglutaminase-like cysteine peptidase [Accumulibacter sp.]